MKKTNVDVDIDRAGCILLVAFGLAFIELFLSALAIALSPVALIVYLVVQ